VTAQTAEERLRALEDLEEIRTLMAMYTRYWDSGIDPEAGDEAERARRFSELFVEDGVWEVPKLGFHYQGRPALRDFLERTEIDHTIDADGVRRPLPGLAIHLAVNPYIQLDGDSAVGWWSGLVMGSIAAREQAVWYGIKYKVHFRHTPDGWRFVTITGEMSFMTSFDGPGWVRERFVPPRQLASSPASE
jgi:hypothetical protein